ncbi:hypothetical protein BGX38DRAFT_1153769 [Terfezia claveryi]|nr:hypothetical protein BGX38DRAFT_1153769 [Terfezia claveryi]
MSSKSLLDGWMDGWMVDELYALVMAGRDLNCPVIDNGTATVGHRCINLTSAHKIIHLGGIMIRNTL